MEENFSFFQDLLKKKRRGVLRFHSKLQRNSFRTEQSFHQILNLEDTVSVNHNWFNGFNIRSIVENMDVEREI